MRKLIPLIFALASTVTHAGTQTGQVKFVNVRASDGLITFGIVGGTKTSAQSCNATDQYWAIRNEDSNAGKQQYAMLMSAQASGKVVNISGLNTCDRWSGVEDVDYIQIND